MKGGSWMMLKLFDRAMTWGTGTMLGLMLASSSSADVTAKKLGLGLDKTVVHSELIMNHYLRSVNQEDGLIKQEPRLRFVPVAGVKLFDEALDVYVKGYFDRMENTTAIEQTKQAKLIFESKPWDFAKIFSIQPYAEHKFASLGDDSSTLLASIQNVSKTFKTKLGKMTPAMGVELGTYVYGKTQESDYELDSKIQDEEISSLGLRKDDSGAIKGNKKDQEFYHEWYASFAMVPSALSDLTIDLTTWFTNEYAPAYSVKAGGEEDSRYVRTQSTSERVRLTYKLNDRFSLRNDFTAFQTGAFEGPQEVGEDSFLNELGIIYQIL